MAELNRLLDAALPTMPFQWAGSSLGVPPVDLVETQDALVLTMDLPGYDPKALDLQVEGDVLTVRAEREAPASGTWLRQERTFGSIARSFVLPPTVDATKCEAKSEHGVLTITVPRREEARPRTINVTVKG
ncbi:MAG: Hsp20/alpha crystallin family protein [Archangium sp.]|nr:Hsp20/alpha crystallin family protein [Archangium sp.]